MKNNDILAQIPYTEDGRLSSLILQGRPGIGKTHFAQFLLPLGSPIVRIPMATKTPESFGAYPLPVREEIIVNATDEHGKTLYLEDKVTPQTVTKEVFRVEEALSESNITPLLEHNIGEGFGALILDDVTLGDPSLQAAILEIVQFGVIAGEKLGRNVLIFLTGNKTDDGAYAVEWSKPLLGRCMLIDVEPNFDVWVDLKENSTIDPVIVGFLKDHPHFFAPVVDDPKTTDENGKTPSPRDWTRFGLALANFGGYKNFTPTLLADSLTKYAAAFVGSKAGTAFQQYARNFDVYPTGQELYENDSVWLEVPKDRRDMLSGAIAVTFALRSHAIKLIEQNLDSSDKCFEIIKTMLDRTRMIGNENREVVAYMVQYFLAWAVDDEFKKERQNVVVASCDVLTSQEYKDDTEFRNFLDALYKIKNNKK